MEVLSLVAFLFSKGSVLPDQAITEGRGEDLILITSDLSILAWGSFTAGLDLWNLRARGRRLAILAALIIFLYSGRTYFVAAALGQIPARDTMQWVGETICFVSAIIIFDLFLPGVTSKFKLDGTRFNPQIRS